MRFPGPFCRTGRSAWRPKPRICLTLHLNSCLSGFLCSIALIYTHWTPALSIDRFSLSKSFPQKCQHTLPTHASSWYSTVPKSTYPGLLCYHLASSWQCTRVATLSLSNRRRVPWWKLERGLEGAWSWPGRLRTGNGRWLSSWFIILTLGFIRRRRFGWLGGKQGGLRKFIIFSKPQSISPLFIQCLLWCQQRQFRRDYQKWAVTSRVFFASTKHILWCRQK